MKMMIWYLVCLLIHAEEITTTPAPTIQPTTTPLMPGQIVGCFRDVFGNRDLEHEVEWELIDGLNNNERCVSECLKRGYKYAGCQMGVMCLCSNNYGAYGFSNGCTMTCPGNKTQICGGQLANTVIYTGQGTKEEPTTTTHAPPRHDCADILAQGHTASGVYTLGNGIKTYCDMTTDGGGWTVFQRRQDGSLDFYRNWTEYAAGFGTPDAEFWLGNDNLYTLASVKKYKLRVDLTDFSGKSVYAEYNNFTYGSSNDNYKLISIGTYSGTAGTRDSLTYQVGRQFSTYDQDHDSASDNCAKARHGAWWYGNCGNSNLNGRYYNTRRWDCTSGTGVTWLYWRGCSLKFSEMKIKPTNA